LYNTGPLVKLNQPAGGTRCKQKVP